jgi:VanZ family protein
MAVIFFFSTRQTAGIIPESIPHFIFFKSLHLLEYAFLAVLLFYAFLRKKITIIIAYLYALSDEIHQTFVPGRNGRLRDTFIDLIGIILGLIILKQLRKIKPIDRIFK